MGRRNSILFCCLLLFCITGAALGLRLGRRLPRDELLFVSYDISSGTTPRTHILSFEYPTVDITMAEFVSYPVSFNFIWTFLRSHLFIYYSYFFRAQMLLQGFMILVIPH